MRTQIYATFGPACGTEEVLKKMIEAGMTGMRLNLSHTSLKNSSNYLKSYQSAAMQCGVTPEILIDMQGPELRVGDLRAGIRLEEGEKVLLGNKGIPVPMELISSLEVNDKILLDDGKLLVQVEECRDGNSVLVQVLRGGELRSHKSIKAVEKNVSMPALTAHDLENIKLAKAYGVTALMQPFVRSAKDLQYVRKELDKAGASEVKIFAKIENRSGMEALESLVPYADVIVIARGDLGNDMPLWELPKAQKEIEKICKKHHKPYIVVTQMLSSMENSPVPTRAEVSDIYHAVYHGAWGVMITGESAVGKYPVEAVRYLAESARVAEN